MTAAALDGSFSRLTESVLEEISKIDTIQKKTVTAKENKKTIENSEKKHTNKCTLVPVHNSLQHDPAVSAPLLTMLVDALKKDASEETPLGLEIIADEISDKKVDAVVALAERIKKMYANEMMQQAYISAAQSTYNPLAQYTQENSVKLAVSSLNIHEGYDEAKKSEPKATSDETSIGYKLSRGDKYQAFIMTDPKGRIHSSWEIVRILNESYNGMIERNDGLHGQWLS